MSTNGTCTHIKVTGVRCGSPSLKGEQFCYFHQNAHRTVRRPKQSRLHPIALIEDEESIQYALMEVINALMKNTIDLKRATLILRALHIAVKNASRVKFEIRGKSAVTKVPDYAPPPERARITPRPEAKAKPSQSVGTDPLVHPASAASVSPVHAADEAKDVAVAPRTAAANVGTAAIGCPAKAKPSANVGADASSAPRPQRSEERVTTAVPPHNFKPPQPNSVARQTATQSEAPQRKRPQPATALSKDRKPVANTHPERSRSAARHG